MSPYLTPKQLAFELDVSETTVTRWCRTGYFLSYKVGGRWRIDPDVDLELLSNPMNERVRQTIPGEFWDMADFKGMTRVMQLAPGARTRTAIQPTKQDLEESERLSRWMSLMHHAEDGLQ